MRTFAFTISLILLGALTAPAEASLRVCNKTNAVVSVAYAYVSHDVHGEIFAIYRGWYPIQSNACEVLNTAADALDTSKHWYIYARNDAGVIWDGKPGGRGAGDSHGHIYDTSTAVTDQYGYVWHVGLDICVPDSDDGVPSIDDLHKSCNRLSYFLANTATGTNYSVELD